MCTTHSPIRLSSGVHNTVRSSCGRPYDLPNPNHCHRAHSHGQQTGFLRDSILKKKTEPSKEERC